MKTKKFKVVPNPDGYGHRVRWPDGELSADYYNLTWAKEHARVLQENDRREAYRQVSIDVGRHRPCV